MVEANNIFFITRSIWIVKLLVLHEMLHKRSHIAMLASLIKHKNNAQISSFSIYQNPRRKYRSCLQTFFGEVVFCHRAPKGEKVIPISCAESLGFPRVPAPLRKNSRPLNSRTLQFSDEPLTQFWCFCCRFAGWCRILASTLWFFPFSLLEPWKKNSYFPL